jgi:hypothetical protein
MNRGSFSKVPVGGIGVSKECRIKHGLGPYGVGWQDGTASGCNKGYHIQRGFATHIAWSVRPGGDGDGKRSFGLALAAVRVTVGGAEVAVLSPYASPSGAGQVALIGRTVWSGKVPTSSPAGQTHTVVGADSDECVLPDGSPSRREKGTPGGGALERRDQPPLRDGSRPMGSPCTGGPCSTGGGVRGEHTDTDGDGDAGAGVGPRPTAGEALHGCEGERRWPLR